MQKRHTRDNSIKLHLAKQSTGGGARKHKGRIIFKGASLYFNNFQKVLFVYQELFYMLVLFCKGKHTVIEKRNILKIIDLYSDPPVTFSMNSY